MHVNNEWLFSRSFSGMFPASCWVGNRLAVANAKFEAHSLFCRLSQAFLYTIENVQE